jgi:penicillin-binding protein 1A
MIAVKGIGRWIPPSGGAVPLPPEPEVPAPPTVPPPGEPGVADGLGEAPAGGTEGTLGDGRTGGTDGRAGGVTTGTPGEGTGSDGSGDGAGRPATASTGRAAELSVKLPEAGSGKKSTTAAADDRSGARVRCHPHRSPLVLPSGPSCNLIPLPLTFGLAGINSFKTVDTSQ